MLNFFKWIGIIIFLISSLSFSHMLINSYKEIEDSSLHYQTWLSQQPENHPMKKAYSELADFQEYSSAESISFGIARDITIEAYQYTSNINYGKLGSIFSCMIKMSKKSSLSKYHLVDTTTDRNISKLKLTVGDEINVDFYHEDTLIPLDMDWGEPSIDIDFALAYVDDASIVTMNSQDCQIRAIDIGKTNLVIVYNKQIIKIPISVSNE